jgi:REP element-mobilizing transposase RayT
MEHDAKDPPHSWRLRKGRHSQPGYAYAITKCTKDRLPILTGDAADIVIGALKAIHQKGDADCLGFVVMPDHVHAVLWLHRGNLSAIISSLAKFTAREINRLNKKSGPLWQEGFYDHGIRGEKSLLAYLRYIQYNPVRAGLVATAEDWPYSAIFPKW